MQQQGIDIIRTLNNQRRDLLLQPFFSEDSLSALIVDEAVLKPEAHQAIYEEMKKALQSLVSSGSFLMLILQEASCLDKSHCTEHYFYHKVLHTSWLFGSLENRKTLF